MSKHDEECNCDQALELKERVKQLEFMCKEFEAIAVKSDTMLQWQERFIEQLLDAKMKE